MPKQILLSASAAFLFALGAASAYAQDAQMSDPDMTKSEAVMDAAEETMKAAEETMEAAEDLEAQSPDADGMVKDDMMAPDAAMDDAMMEKQPTMETAPAPAAPSTTVAVACPEGTEAQADGTCMVTGNWQGE